MRDPGEAPGIGRLKRRADFVRVGKGKRWHAKAMTIQVAASPHREDAVRVGFTLTRKVGNAVVRNRARRRLREAVRLADTLPVAAGHDYVVIGRVDAVRMPFDRLRSVLVGAFQALQRSNANERRKPAPKSPDTR